MEQTMEERYADYLKRFGIAHAEPMTYEEYVKWASECDAQKAAALATAATITIYASYVARAAGVDRYDAEDIIEEMRKIHDAECKRLYEAGDQALLGGHIEAFETASKAIMAPHRRQRRPVTIVASQVYDDDDHPTTHRIGF